MSLITPLGLLGLLGIPIIIIIYLLKSKYVSKPVSSTYIWKRSLKYVKNRLPLNFVFSLLLILQLLTVIAASLAMSRPTLRPLTTKDTIIILDTSASMMTVNDEGKTRYELAVEKIQQEANLASENHKFTLITAGTKSKAIKTQAKERTEITTALADIVCGSGTSDLAGALESAKEVQKKNPEAKIYFYTDKEYDEVSGLEIVNFAKETDWNLAITSLTDVSMGGKFFYNVVVENFGPAVENVTINFYLDDEVSPYTKTCSFEENSKTVVTFASKGSFAAADSIFVQIGSISEYDKVKVEFSEIDDGISADNTRTLYSKSNKRAKILLVSEYIEMVENGDGTLEADGKTTTFLLMVLRTIGYNLSVKTDIKNDIDLVNNGKALEGYDLYIFDGGAYTDEDGEYHKIMPEDLPDDGAVWFINPEETPPIVDENDVPLIEVSADPVKAEKNDQGTLDAFSMIKAVSSGSAMYNTLTNKVQAKNLAVGKYYPISYYAPENFEQIYTCNNDTVLVAGRVNNIRVICWSLDVNDTNIHFNRDFPMLVQNMVNYSLPDVISEREFIVGDEIAFNAPVGAQTISFKLGDNVLNVKDAQDMSFVLSELGLYSIDIEFAKEDAEIKTFYMPTNIPLEESDITAIGESAVAAEVSLDEKPKYDPIEIWPYIAMILLAILIIEWGVYYRDEF